MELPKLLAANRANVTTTLLHGDCLQVMPALAAGSVAMVFADLPYTVTACSWDVAIDVHIFWPQIKHVLQSKGLCIASAVMRFAAGLIASNARAYKYDIVWHKNKSTGFFNAKNAPLRAHEHLLLFGEGKNIYNAQMTHAASPRRGSSFMNGGRSEYLDVDHCKHTYVYGDLRYPNSIVKMPFPSGERGMHPTQKPVALLEWLIKTYTNPGDTVLDPVAGSGTTAIAALRTGRHAICIEKESTYFAVMQNRVAKERARLGL